MAATTHDEPPAVTASPTAAATLADTRRDGIVLATMPKESGVEMSKIPVVLTPATVTLLPKSL